MKESRITKDEIHELQFKRLKNILCDAYNRHPFYHRRFDNCKFNPYKMASIKEIQEIPVLSKEEYCEFTKKTYESNAEMYQSWYIDGTSGSTGTPLKIYRSWDERAYMSAKWMRVLILNGYTYTDKVFSVPSPHRLQRDSILQRIGIMKRYSVPYTATTEKMVRTYLDVKPSVVYANKSQLVMMSEYCQKNEIVIPKPKLCISAAETMDENSKSIIGDTFGANTLVEVYGAVEFNNLAWQTLDNSLYSFSHTTNLLEIIDKGYNDRNHGRTIVTDFFIRSFPLIRYDLGDTIEVENNDGIPYIRKIIGRSDDWVIKKDGERIPFHIFYEIMERRAEISKFRIIQESYELVKVVAVIRPENDRNKVEKILMEDLESSFPGSGFSFSIEWVDDIPPDPNGKLRMLVSKVNQE